MLRFLREKRWFFAAMAVALVMLLSPLPAGLGREGMIVLAMTVASTIMFITEPVPLPTVALLIVAGQVLLLGHGSSSVAKSMMNDSVLFIMGSLMLAVAMVKQRLDKRLALFIVSLTGTRTVRVAMGISLVSGLLASLIGEHTVAAMMLPIAVSLIQLSEEDGREQRNLAVLLLFSISFACSLAGVGTPSGGARNAIMIGYWRSFFYDVSDPTTAKYLIDYPRWMAFAYPMLLIQLPVLSILLYKTFKPEKLDLAVAVRKLKEQVEKEGPLTPGHWATIALFILVLVSWIFFSGKLGMGTIAITGAAAFLVAGLVRWNDINSGVNWGVVLLYGAAISLGVQMEQSGAAGWLAENFLALLRPLGADKGLGLWLAVALLTTLITNTMSNGAAVAVLGPIVLKLAQSSGSSPITIGFITAISSAFAYFTVVGTPASTIVHSSGYLRPSDFFKIGWKICIVSILTLLVLAGLYWPLLGV